MKNKKVIALLILPVLVIALCFGAIRLMKLGRHRKDDVATVGFIYDNAETTPYSSAFLKAQEAAHSQYQGRVKVMMFSNVAEGELETPLKALIDNSCDIVFTNGYGDMRAMAKKHPDIQFCQASNTPYPESEALSNYHTFKGEIYQGRYVSGVIAGLKLNQLIESGEIKPEDAKVGFVAAYPLPEVISGYTAFILGVRSVCPEATMRVRYTDTWSSHTKEKQCATQLLDEGCVLIGQHSDTVGPALACEEYRGHLAFHVAYNADMTDVAPNTSLVGARIDWTPYVTGAIRAVLEDRPIEEVVDGRVHPMNDMSAGFDKGWVAMTRLNAPLLPEGAKETMEKLVEDFREGKIDVFRGDYIAVDPENPENWIDLHEGYRENADSSIPTFDYILQDVVTVED